MSAKTYKVVLFGEFGSGRTTFAARSTEGKAGKSKIASIKAETYPITINTSAGTLSVVAYDTTLHAKGGVPDEAFFRNADAGIGMFDLTSQASYDGLPKWYDAFYKANHRRGGEDVPVLILGTKADAKGRELKPADIDWPRKKGLPYAEVSAKANHGVAEAWLEIVRGLMGASTQLTSEIELVKADATVDADALAKLLEEYNALK
ncbi:hypothetical protein Q5752_003946 [Cryptotrichosporon argae]